MSMLAEPRRKQKWTLNPRGKQWSEDSNKFGQKMLEKMGWSSGKGLGAHQQGATEHVRVSFKNDTGGIGYKKDDLDKAWTENQDDFNHFLQQLQQSQDDSIVQPKEIKVESSEKSLELKSKTSRARIHYHKFTRGKDVHRYSSKDLANIFGQKELNVQENDNESKSVHDENFESNAIGATESRGGVVTIHGGSMADYFLKKSQSLSLTPSRGRQSENNSESEQEYVGFGFNSKEQSNENEEKSSYAFENPCLRLNSPECTPNSKSKLRLSKKRKNVESSEPNVDCKKHKEDIENDFQSAFVNPALSLETETNETANGKEFEVPRTQFGITNSGLDLRDEKVDKKRVTFNDHVEYSTDSSKKKEKGMLDKFEVENKKSKKKKKQENNVTNITVSTGIINEALDVEEFSEETNDNEINERKSKKSKKRKSDRRSNLETIVEIPEEDKELVEHKTEEKKSVENENSIDNSASENDLSKKKAKKKKKKKDKVEDEIVINDETKTEENVNVEVKLENEVCDTEHENEEDDCKIKEKKKKKKRKDTESHTENHKSVTVIDSQINVEDEIGKVEEETVKSKKKKQKKLKHEDKNESNTDTISKCKEVSNKENETSESVNSLEVDKPKKEKSKESVEKELPSTESGKEEIIKSKVNGYLQDKKDTPNSKSTKTNKTSSPWNERARTSKKILKSLFYRNSVAHFPGSNIEEIKGYGANLYSKE